MIIALDFIEKLFHVSPDGGNGADEALIVVLVGLLIFASVLTGYLRIRPSPKRKKKKN
jgi:hypothetical protein